MAAMTLGTLKQLLEDLTESGMTDQTEVVIYTQESYPLRLTLVGVTTTEDTLEPENRDDRNNEVILVSGGHPRNGSPYGDRLAWSTARKW